MTMKAFSVLTVKSVDDE
jgi:prohead serine protease